MIVPNIITDKVSPTVRQTVLCVAVLSAAAISACSNQSLETTYNSQETKIDTYAEAVQFIEREITSTFTYDSDSVVTGISYSAASVDTITPRVTRNGGAVRITVIEGEGDQLESGGTVTFYYAGYVFSSGPTSIQIMYVNTEDDDGEDRSSWLFSTPRTTINVSGNLDTGATISGTGSASGLTIFGTNHYLTSQFAGWTLSDTDYSPLTMNIGDSDMIKGLRDGLNGVRAGEVCDIAFTGKYGHGKTVLGTIPANSALLFRIWVESISN